MVCSNLAHHVEAPRTGDSRYFGAETLCDLDRERPDATGGAVDQHPLSALYPSLPERLKRGAARRWYGCRFLEGHVDRFQRQCLLRCDREFRERTEATTRQF